MGQFGPYDRAEDIPEAERKYYYLGDKFRPLSEIEWVDILFNKRWPVRIPKFLHDYHDWWDYWEKECHDSMAEHLKPGMCLYDVGAFDGWQSAVFSQMVGGAENMVLIEPVTEMWPNTRETWRQNWLEAPLGTVLGFASDATTQFTLGEHEWPVGPDYSQMIKAIKFKNLHEHAENTPQVRIDTLSAITRIPDALHIDVEGAGLKVLQGAIATLRTWKPLIWIAIHPEFMINRYHTQPSELHDFLQGLGYRGKCLAVDHEEHWCYEHD